LPTLPRLSVVRVALVVVVACGSPPPPQAARPPEPEPPWAAELADRCRRHDYAPAGSAADYTPPVLDGFAIAPPRMCERGSAYIRIERLAGKRRLGTARGANGRGFNEGCMQAPVPGSADCPVINFFIPGNEAMLELEHHGWPAGGPGMGPCGQIDGDYDAWNMSVEVLSWPHAETAVRAVAAALDRYDAAGVLGVAVKGTDCVELL
jgi:hypothetical protein